MPFLVKAIKPGKMDIRAVQNELYRTLQAEGKIHVQELSKTVKTWRHKVGFGYDIDHRGPDVAVLSGPVSGNIKVWNMLDEGTRPHPITPKRPGGRLAFRWGGRGSYKAKTRPWHLGSTGSSQSGVMHYPRAVRHPGTQAREWSKTLASKRKKPFAANVNSAVRRGAARFFP